MSQNIDLDSWSDSLRAWLNPPEDWVTWYNRVANTYQPTWESMGKANALSLSLSPFEKDENLLKTIGYFWSDALNCFLFGHGPMTPTLLDVTMITGLDIASSYPSAYRLSEVPFKLSTKAECTNWGTYLSQQQKTKGPVTEKEHSLLEPLVRALPFLWTFPCSNQKLPFSGVRVGQGSHCWPW
jgi:hypothetical protein